MLSGSPSDRRPDLLTVATPGARSNVPFFLACAVFLIVMECLGVSAVSNPHHGPDFRAFYAAGYMVRTHPSTLYDPVLQKHVQDTLISYEARSLPFYHPSYEALIYAPFSLLPYRPAYFAFIAFNVLLLIAVFFAARPVFSQPIPFLQPRPGLIFFLFLPIGIAVLQGQDSILFVLLCCLTWRQLQSGKDSSAGFILALALFRFQLAIPIAILIAIRRGWRFSAAFLAATAAVLLLCVGIVGRAGIVSLLNLLSASSMSADQRDITQLALGIYPRSMANLRGLLYASGTGHLSPVFAFSIIAVVSLAIFFACVFLVRREKRESAAFAIAILCAMLVSYHLNLHDGSLLVLPIALLAQGVSRILLVVCYYLPFVLFFFAGPNWFFLLAIPTLALLHFASKIEHEPAAMLTPASTPLYTQK
jgi:hypothetical protein